MFKILFLLMAWLPLADQNMSLQVVTCNCPMVTNLQSSGQINRSITISWSSHTSATNYAIYYTRQEDAYSSPIVITAGVSYTFDNLPDGSYNFHVGAICGTASSSFIGVEDIIE